MSRPIAYAISVLFHPLLMLTYMVIILLAANPFLFGASDVLSGGKYVLLVFLSSFFLPAVGVGLMRGIGFISSFHIEDQQERIAPFIMTGVFYLWITVSLIKTVQMPPQFAVCALGATIGLFLAFFINLFSKISLHTVGVGGLLGMTLQLLARYGYSDLVFGTFSMPTTYFLVGVVLLIGLVATARLVLDAHEPDQIYGGLLVGIFAQFLAAAFV
jgi:hypothetical protein